MRSLNHSGACLQETPKPCDLFHKKQGTENNYISEGFYRNIGDY